MPMYETTNGGALLTPAQVAQLLVLPAVSASIAAQSCTVVTISTKAFRVPLVTADPAAQWVDEGQEIAPSDATLSELTVTPSKVAGLTILSQELADDSSPEAASVVGDGLARDIARKVDAAFFGALAAPAPVGLGALAGIVTLAVPVSAPPNDQALDTMLGALAAAESAGAQLDHFVCGPNTALTLATIKSEDFGRSGNKLQPDPTQPTRRMIAGVPLLVSPAVAEDVIWGLDSSRVYLVVRDDATVETDRSVFFTSHRVAIRAIMRVGFAFPHPASVVKITLA